MRIINTPDFIKKHKILTVVLAILVALCAWWTWAQFAPHPLGDKMEYLGKEDYGNILGFDYRPYSEYYYGTDIPPEEMAGYFKDTKLEYPIEDKGQYTDVYLVYRGKKLSLTYIQDAPTGIRKTNKKYIVSVLNADYKLAEQALR